MSIEGFLDGMCEAVPMTRSLVEQHIEDQSGEVLLHLLVADVRRLAFASFERGDEAVTTCLLDFLDLALATGDAPVRNAIAVPFVEGTGWWDPSTSSSSGSPRSGRCSAATTTRRLGRSNAATGSGSKSGPRPHRVPGRAGVGPGAGLPLAAAFLCHPPESARNCIGCIIGHFL